MSDVNIFKNIKYVQPIPTITVNLSLPPLERWHNVIEECTAHGVSVKKLVSETHQYMDSMLPSQSWWNIQSTSISFFGKYLRHILLFVLWLICRLFFEYWEDVAAIATLVNVHPGEIFLANMAYEVLGGCTTFVSHDEDGKPMLARTLDWPMPLLAKYTVQFRWILERRKSCKLESKSESSGWEGGMEEVEEEKEEVVLFQSVGWPGYVGVMTAMKPGHFSVALNARYCAAPTDSLWYTVLHTVLKCRYTYGLNNVGQEEVEDENVQESLNQVHRVVASLWSSLSFFSKTRAWSTGSILRHALENPNIDNFEKVVSFLHRERLVSVCYFIVAGTRRDEGVVLTREREPGCGTQRYMRSLSSKDVGFDSYAHDNSTGTGTGTVVMDMDTDEGEGETGVEATESFVCQTNIDIPLLNDSSPDDFNSIDRYNIIREVLLAANTNPPFNSISNSNSCKKNNKSGVRRTGASMTAISGTSSTNNTISEDAARVLMTSMVAKKGRPPGVRMKMSLYCAIMHAYSGQIFAAKSSRQVGP